MRILVTTRGSAGHVLPLTPLGHASRRAGHEVLVVAQHHNEHNVPRTSLPFAGVDAAPDEAWMPVQADFGRLDSDAAKARMAGGVFDLPDPASTEALGTTVRTVLADRSFADHARAIAQAMAALAPVEDAVEVLAAAAATRAAA